MGVQLTTHGSFDNVEKFLNKANNLEITVLLNKYGRMGMEALRSATPKDTGATSRLWDYKIKQGENESSITWVNHNINKGVNIAIILQYGHGTNNGGYVVGRDYINPALASVFDGFARDLWKEVSG